MAASPASSQNSCRFSGPLGPSQASVRESTPFLLLSEPEGPQACSVGALCLQGTVPCMKSTWVGTQYRISAEEICAERAWEEVNEEGSPSLSLGFQKLMILKTLPKPPL